MINYYCPSALILELIISSSRQKDLILDHTLLLLLYTLKGSLKPAL